MVAAHPLSGVLYLSHWDTDGGQAARAYASRPPHLHTAETYPLIVEALERMRPTVRVLDIGAGPGNLAWEAYRLLPERAVHFTNLDPVRSMLDLADQRATAAGWDWGLVQRNPNDDDWAGGLGPYDCIVSNNALFHVTPDRLANVYGDAFDLLEPGGLLFNHQVFGWRAMGITGLLRELPDLLAYDQDWPELRQPSCQWMRAAMLHQRQQRQAKLREQVELLRAAGRQAVIKDDAFGYAGLHLPVATHLETLRAVGFHADVIWQRGDAAMIMGIKAP